MFNETYESGFFTVEPREAESHGPHLTALIILNIHNERPLDMLSSPCAIYSLIPIFHKIFTKARLASITQKKNSNSKSTQKLFIENLSKINSFFFVLFCFEDPLNLIIIINFLIVLKSRAWNIFVCFRISSGAFDFHLLLHLVSYMNSFSLRWDKSDWNKWFLFFHFIELFLLMDTNEPSKEMSTLYSFVYIFFFWWLH